MKYVKCPCCGKKADKTEENCPFCLFRLTPFTPEEEESALKSALKHIFSPMGYFMADFTIIRAAAKKGNAEAQCRLGDVYLHGFEHIPQSRRKAKMWYKKSAANGYAPAAEILKRFKEL